MKKNLYLLAFVLLLAAGCGQASQISDNLPGGQSTSTPGGKTACTMEAKQCPNGSYVSRIPPTCEFATCPTSTPPKPTTTPPAAESGIKGKILLGPTCPVQRIPPDPKCADKPYQATVKVESADGQKVIIQFTSQADGTFQVKLQPGQYLLVPVSGSMPPIGRSQEVTVKANQFTDIDLFYDTGIR